MATTTTAPETKAQADSAKTRDSLTITDNRTGKEYVVPIENDTIRAMDLRKIKVQPNDFGLMTYDPAFLNTASCKSKITYIDGDKGILEYRGYPIEQLAEKSTFLEVAWLLWNGELPTEAELDEFTRHVTIHTYLHENIKKFMEGFRHDAHPMGMLQSTVGALSTFYPDAKHVNDERQRAPPHRSASSRRCRRSPRSPTATRSASRTSTPTTSSPTSATSSRCSGRCPSRSTR